jgi:acyl carrier protein
MKKKKELTARLEKIFIEIFQLSKKKYSSKNIKYIDEKNIKNWDSLRKLNLIMAVEQEFKIKIKDRQIDDFISFIKILKILQNQL